MYLGQIKMKVNPGVPDKNTMRNRTQLRRSPTEGEAELTVQLRQARDGFSFAPGAEQARDQPHAGAVAVFDVGAPVDEQLPERRPPIRLCQPAHRVPIIQIRGGVVGIGSCRSRRSRSIGVAGGLCIVFGCAVGCHDKCRRRVSVVLAASGSGRRTTVIERNRGARASDRWAHIVRAAAARTKTSR